MKRISLLLLPLLFVFATPPENDKSLYQSDKFALNLFKQLIKNNTENLFFSPYSIQQALAMVYDGASGKTKTEMQQTLGFKDDKVGPYFNKMNHIFSQSSDSLTLTMNNSLWPQKNYPFLPEYFTSINENYKATIKYLDYSTYRQQNKSAKKINKWVKKSTSGQIDKIISVNDLNELTRLVLANTIYFKGSWQKSFKKENTFSTDFHNLNETKSRIEMMKLKANFNYYESEELQAIEIPYAGNKFSMMVILPKVNKYTSIENQLNEKLIEKISKQMHIAEVNLNLPKFTMESDLQLKQYLANMGMPLAFSKHADFSGMTGKKDLKIDKVLHKSFIEVSETGTEASAATAVIMVRKTASLHEINFTANKPFIYAIKSQETKQILFLGRMVNKK